MILRTKIDEARALLPQLQKILEEIRQILEGATVETDAFVVYLKNARKSYRKKCWDAHKSGKRVDAYIHSSWLEARSDFHFRGSREIWEHLLEVEPRKRNPDETGI